MKKYFFTILFLTIALTVFSQANYRDVVHLKNGSVIKGMIIEQVPNKQIKIETADGSVFVYEMSDIEKMAKEKTEEVPSSWKTENKGFSSPTAKGQIMLGGSSDLSFSSISPDGGDSQTEFKIRPTIGTFVADNFGIGIMLNYEDYENNSLFLLGPVIRYYFGTSKIKPYLQGEYVFGNQKYDNGYEDEKYDVNGFALGGGSAFFLNQHISIDMGLAYTKYNIEDYDSDGIVLSGGISVYF
ncbi:outer membrane beta-barrel protein [Marinilabilia sp.]|uniref:outer membrane beta-barrel protein n=1 Tax=Marinilabilia sp. TaxID=2021252 RepID=UPI0025C69512|nr:outer membrane beta-barrel protein [Marinilabilia sp.]